MVDRAPAASQHPSIVIIGGGASGTLLAVHLLREDPNLEVTLVEKRSQLGRGIAYSAQQQDHVLNVPAGGMSAFADEPDHFRKWLLARGLIGPDETFPFAPRRLYGAYLADILAATATQGRLTFINATAIDVRPGLDRTPVLLDTGETLTADAAVLAVGHEESQARSRGVAVRVGSAEDTPLAPHLPVMILGSGLSMVDAWLTLAQRGHTGPISVVSRHGLLPQAHREVPRIAIEAAEVPIGAPLLIFERWFRDKVSAAVAQGADWRSVVDALRPFNQRIWQGWSLPSRRQFLRHLRPFWNVHRHRLPPAQYARLAAAVQSGQVTLRAGEVVGLAAADTGVEARVRPKGTATVETLPVARVYDCGGVSVDVAQSSNPLVTALVTRGDARPDSLGIGLDVTTACAVIDSHGTPHQRLFAIGPLTRGTFFEIEAIPDIRVQAADLVARLLPLTGAAAPR